MARTGADDGARYAEMADASRRHLSRRLREERSGHGEEYAAERNLQVRSEIEVAAS